MSQSETPTEDPGSDSGETGVGSEPSGDFAVAGDGTVALGTLADERVDGESSHAAGARPGAAATRPKRLGRLRGLLTPARIRRGLFIVGAALGGAVVVAVLAVAAYRVVEPPFTITMALRAAAGEDVRRTTRPLEAISPNLVRAVIAAEDGRFCSHDGFDRVAIAQAMEAARSGQRLRGASTISQQTAKNAYLWTGGGWPRKAVEAGFTVMIEAAWPKRRIMEVYLNAAEWGDGLFGAEAAAQARFGKSAADLTTREAALLAAVLPSPNRWRLDPPGDYVAGRAATLESRMRDVRRDGLATCVLEGG